MYLSICDSGEKGAAEALTIDAASLYCAFEQVTDGRKKKGKRYPLPLLLTLLLLGKLAGETTVSGIVDGVKERQAWLRAQLDWPKRFPTNSTYSEALARYDAQQIVTVVASVLLKARAVEQCGTEPSRLEVHKQEEALTHVAMDGKTLRGTLGHESEGQPSVHLLSLYECQSGIVLTQRAVQSKENEISAAAALVHPARVERRHHQYRCHAHPKEVVRLCACVWWVLPDHCEKESAPDVSGSGGFLCRSRCRATGVAVRKKRAKRARSSRNPRNLDEYADECLV